MDIHKWKKKKEKAQIDGNLDAVYFACKELAELYFNSENYDAALHEYREMERMSEISGNQIDVGRASRMIGEVFCAKGEFEKAIRHQLKHLVISREEKNKVEEQRALATLGRTYFLQSESIADLNCCIREKALDEAKKFYMESLAICHQLTDAEVGHKQKMEMVARLFLNIGLVLDAQNHFDSAIEHMQKAVSICKKLDLWEDLYRTYSALGGTYQKHYQKNQAIKTFDLALNVAERLSNKAQMMCDILQMKADVLLDLPDVRGARQVLLKAYKLNEDSSKAEIEKKLRIVAVMCENEEQLTELSPDSDFCERKKIYEEMGDAASELNNFKLALSYYHLMLECVEKCGNEQKALIDSYISLAQTYKDDLQLTKALEFFQKELELEEKNSPEACKTLLNIAEVYQLMGRRTEMYDVYEKAKNVSIQSSDRKLKKTVLSLLHGVLIEDGKLSEANSIKKELNGFETDPFEDSSDEEEEPRKELGAHICLDDLTDEEVGKDQKQEEKAKLSRTRAKRLGNLEKRNEKGETPLHVAAINGNVNLVKKLIDQGHRVDVKDYSGWTPLHEACNHGHSEVVSVLLERGAPINDRGGPHCDGVTPLLDAASNGNLDIIELLLNHGASPLMRTNSGDSVIDCLSGWRRRRFEEVGSDLQGSALAHYSNVYKKLTKILENAGQKLQKKDISPLKESSNKLRPKKPNSFSGLEKPFGLEKKVIENSKNAANEYENAMKALRYKNSKPNMAKEVPVPVRGLVNEDELVGDDWLEDDLESFRPRKKPRTGEHYHELIGRRSRETMRPVTPPSPERSPTPPSPTRSISSPILSISNQNELETIVNLTPSPLNDREKFSTCFGPIEAPSPTPSDRFPDANLLKRKQVSLTKLGVVKKMNFNNPKYGNEMPHSSQVSSNVPAQAQLTYSCVKVKIEGKIVIVPVPGGGEGLTISWLSSEAASRYKSLEGAEPVLQLEMEGGGLLINSDPLTIITQSGTTLVEGRVLSWNLTSPVTLYEEACSALNTGCNQEIKYVLDKSQATGVVSVEDMYLKWATLNPLFRAISHYQLLQSLVLSSNNISDIHILDIAECVIKLPQLRVLDLSNTNITGNGLEKFAQCITKNSALKLLEELKLGHNPLGDCLRPLSSLLNSTNHLRHLSIPDIGLTSRSFPSFTQCSLDCIEILDVNYNRLGGEGVREFLGLLDPRMVKVLRLAGSGGETVREVGFYLEQRAPPNLRLLDLSFCPYSSADLQQFTRGADMCEALENVSLDGVEAPKGSLETLLNLPLKQLSLCAGTIPSDLTLPSQMDKLIVTGHTTGQVPAMGKLGPFGFCLIAK